MKQSIWIIIIGVVVIGLAIALIITQTKKEPEEIKIGAILPLTGEMASHGEDAKKGIELAVEIKNKLGGIRNKKILVIYENDKMQPHDGVAAFQKLITINKAPVVLGGIGSSVALAIAPIAEKEKVVFISPTASSPKLTVAGDYIFRNWPSDIFEGGEMVKASIETLGVKKVAILYVNNDFGQGIKEVFRKKFEEFGGEVLIEETYEQGTNDFRSQLTKIKNKNPEAIYLPGYYQEVARILKQAKEMGIQARFLSTTPIENPKLIELAGNAAEGVIYTRPAFDPANPDENYKKFALSFKERYGVEPGIAAAFSYDAMNIILLSIEKGGPIGPGIQKAMAGIKDFLGVTGNISFDKNGDVIKEMMLFTVKDGQFVPYSK